jgi:hypothetical protein
MIVDQLFTPKPLQEGGPYDLPGIDYPRSGDTPRKQSSGEQNPYPYSPEEDDDYFREIFRKKREAAAKDPGMAEGLGYSQDPAQAKWYHEGRKAFKGGTTGNLIQDIAKKHGCPPEWIDAFHAGYEDQQGFAQDDVTENAQKSMPFYGTNPATGQARTYDELLAKSQAGTTPATPNFAPQGSGSKSMNTGINLPTTTAPATPAVNVNTMQTKKIKKSSSDSFTPDEISKMSPFVQKQLSGIKEALTQPVTELLQMVETKEDVQRIKQFVDETFVRYGAVNESAFALRNQILEHVTQVGAQRRREHSQRMAT